MLYANPEIPLRFTQPVETGLELMCANVNCKYFLFTQSIEIEIKHFLIWYLYTNSVLVTQKCFWYNEKVVYGDTSVVVDEDGAPGVRNPLKVDDLVVVDHLAMPAPELCNFLKWFRSSGSIKVDNWCWLQTRTTGIHLSNVHASQIGMLDQLEATRMTGIHLSNGHASQIGMLDQLEDTR